MTKASKQRFQVGNGADSYPAVRVVGVSVWRVRIPLSVFGIDNIPQNFGRDLVSTGRQIQGNVGRAVGVTLKSVSHET